MLRKIINKKICTQRAGFFLKFRKHLYSIRERRGPGGPPIGPQEDFTRRGYDAPGGPGGLARRQRTTPARAQPSVNPAQTPAQTGELEPRPTPRGGAPSKSLKHLRKQRCFPTNFSGGPRGGTPSESFKNTNEYKCQTLNIVCSSLPIPGGGASSESFNNT